MLQILSHDETIRRLKIAPHEMAVICITNKDTPIPVGIAASAAEFLHLSFDDIDVGENSPQRHHVEEALAFANDREDIVICCHAGISRSSAIAYVIECSKKIHPAMAVGIWDKKRHHPNRKIINLGEEILGDPNIGRHYIKWMNS